jgi:hypothetical protein
MTYIMFWSPMKTIHFFRCWWIIDIKSVRSISLNLFCPKSNSLNQVSTLLASSQLTRCIHWPCYCTVHDYVFIVCGLSEWKFFLLFVYICIDIWDLIIIMFVISLIVCVQWFEMRGNCSCCWYYRNCWPSLFKLSFIMWCNFVYRFVQGRIYNVYTSLVCLIDSSCLDTQQK